jgi:hypothetical protein
MDSTVHGMPMDAKVQPANGQFSLIPNLRLDLNISSKVDLHHMKQDLLRILTFAGIIHSKKEMRIRIVLSQCQFHKTGIHSKEPRTIDINQSLTVSSQSGFLAILTRKMG